MFAYIDSLQLWKIYNEIEEGFLPIGHTQKDIDQAFSRTSNLLGSENTVTLSDFNGVLRKTFSDAAKLIRMKKIINWSGLREQSKALNKMKPFSQLRFFRFCRAFNNVRAFITQCQVKSICDE